MKICNKCAAVFRNEICTLSEMTICPLEYCYGEPIIIDEIMYEICTILANKQYRIMYCKSGDRNIPTFIHIGGRYTGEIPKGFRIKYFKDGESGDIISDLYKTYNIGLSSTELKKKILRTILDMFKWAENLDYNDNWWM